MPSSRHSHSLELQLAVIFSNDTSHTRKLSENEK